MDWSGIYLSWPYMQMHAHSCVRFITLPVHHMHMQPHAHSKHTCWNIHRACMGGMQLRPSWDDSSHNYHVLLLSILMQETACIMHTVCTSPVHLHIPALNPNAHTNHACAHLSCICTPASPHTQPPLHTPTFIHLSVADMEPWERIGSSSSPFTGNMQELAPNISKLLYDWADLLEAITTPISNPEAAPQDGRTGGAGVGSARGQDGAGATNVGGVRQQVQQQQQHQGGSGSSQRGPTSRAGQLQPPAAVPAAAAAARGGAAPPAVGGRRSGYHSGSDGSSSDSGSGSTDEGSGGSSMGGGGRRGKRRAIGSTPRGSLLWAARAPTRAWLQSFFSDLRADNRQVSCV